MASDYVKYKATSDGKYGLPFVASVSELHVYEVDCGKCTELCFGSDWVAHYAESNNVSCVEVTKDHTGSIYILSQPNLDFRLSKFGVSIIGELNQWARLVKKAVSSIWNRLDMMCEQISCLHDRIVVLEEEKTKETHCANAVSMPEADDVVAWLNCGNAFKAPDCPVSICDVRVDRPDIPTKWDIENMSPVVPWDSSEIPRRPNALTAATKPESKTGKWVFSLYCKPLPIAKNEVPL